MDGPIIRRNVVWMKLLVGKQRQAVNRIDMALQVESNV